MEQAVEHRGDGGGVAEELAPILDGPVRRDERRGPFVAPHDDLQEILASAMEPLALPPGRLALALLGFNLGVEAGQALVVALLLPLLLLMRGSGWESGMVRAASLGVAVMGLAWLVERLFFV